jgi:membrane protein
MVHLHADQKPTSDAASGRDPTWAKDLRAAKLSLRSAELGVRLMVSAISALMAEPRGTGHGNAKRAIRASAPQWNKPMSTDVREREAPERLHAGDGGARNRAMEEADRGRLAEMPSEIRASGWKDILLRVWRGISEDRILLVAGGVTFYLILAIFPGIAALISIYGLFADPATITNHLDTIANIAPGGAMQILHDELTRLASRGGTTLSVGFLISLVISLWFTNSGVSALFDALNIVYEEQEKRGFIKYYVETLTFTIATIIFVLLSIAVVVAVPVALSFMPLPGGTDLLVRIVRWPILLVLVGLALAVLYRFGPSRTAARWRWITWGSAFATVGWLAVSFLFSWYVAHFGSYDKTYGSLGAIMGFMTWIWISLVVVLIGAKLDAEMERRTAR